MKISAVLIVKNEEELLGRCLESVKDADEIIVCDTGSTDRTIEIALQYTDKVYTDFVWCDDFAKARNHAKAKATGDWIISIDADEFLHNFSEVRKAVELAENTVSVYMEAELKNGDFRVPRIFRNSPDICWHGAIHNHLSISGIGEMVGNVKMTYGFSPTHTANPDRTLNILLKEVQDSTKCRERYYLGRELWMKGRHEEAIPWLKEHVGMTNFTAEKVDSYITMARCYSSLGKDDEARTACAQALILNPYLKEAVLLMAAISLDDNAPQWRTMAATADNRNAYFIRSL